MLNSNSNVLDPDVVNKYKEVIKEYEKVFSECNKENQRLSGKEKEDNDAILLGWTDNVRTVRKKLEYQKSGFPSNGRQFPQGPASKGSGLSTASNDTSQQGKTTQGTAKAKPEGGATGPVNEKAAGRNGEGSSLQDQLSAMKKNLKSTNDVSKVKTKELTEEGIKEEIEQSFEFAKDAIMEKSGQLLDVSNDEELKGNITKLVEYLAGKDGVFEKLQSKCMEEAKKIKKEASKKGEEIESASSIKNRTKVKVDLNLFEFTKELAKEDGKINDEKVSKFLENAEKNIIDIGDYVNALFFDLLFEDAKGIQLKADTEEEKEGEKKTEEEKQREKEKKRQDELMKTYGQRSLKQRKDFYGHYKLIYNKFYIAHKAQLPKLNEFVNHADKSEKDIYISLNTINEEDFNPKRLVEALYSNIDAFKKSELLNGCKSTGNGKKDTEKENIRKDALRVLLDLFNAIKFYGNCGNEKGEVGDRLFTEKIPVNEDGLNALIGLLEAAAKKAGIIDEKKKVKVAKPEENGYQNDINKKISKEISDADYEELKKEAEKIEEVFNKLGIK